MRVFISHAGTDSPLARRVADSLRKSGLEVWLDVEQILPGDDWGARISTALQQADAMVVLLTPQSLRSQNLDFEIGYALGNEDYKGRLIPVLVGSPDQLSGSEIPWILNRLRMVRLENSDPPEGDVSKIAQALLAAA